jgi:PKD repeat protein
VTLTVTSDAGLTDTATRIVQVADRPPTASLSFSPKRPRHGRPVTLSAYADDPDGTVTAVRWSFGDGGRASGWSVHHTYRRRGRYRVTLTATDNSGSATIHAAVVSVS